MPCSAPISKREGPSQRQKPRKAVRGARTRYDDGDEDSDGEDEAAMMDMMGSDSDGGGGGGASAACGSGAAGPSSSHHVAVAERGTNARRSKSVAQVRSC